jgi:hypothetical protein
MDRMSIFRAYMPERTHKFSRLGGGFVLLYASAIVICLAMAFGADGDPKGRFVFLQLPIVLQGTVLSALGLGSLLSGMSWGAAYATLAIPTFALLYLLGWAIDSERSAAAPKKRSAKNGTPLD